MERVKEVPIGRFFSIGADKLTLIGGPCAIESGEMCFEVAETVKGVCDKLGIQYVFKGSFDKANRSNPHAGRGVGMEKGLEILADVREKFGVPVTTDVHETWQCAPTAEVVDILQIPAYLCRQTDLIIGCAKTGRPVNIKKGQFMAPWNMNNVVNKMKMAGNEGILLCERGTTFGYNRLVVDMPGLLEMRRFGYPVVLDATHSVQHPGSNEGFTAGDREYAPYLMYAGLAVGVDAIFAEIHPDPDKAVSDGPSQLRLDKIEEILTHAVEYDKVTRRI